MPFFSFSITTPLNTPRAAKKKTEMSLSPGIIHRVRVRIPPGSKGLLHCIIWHHLHQIAPLGEGQDFHGDDEIIDYQDFYPIKGLDTRLDAYTWNESTNYDHEIILQFGVLPRWVLVPYAVGEKLMNAWNALVGKEYEVE